MLLLLGEESCISSSSSCFFDVAVGVKIASGGSVAAATAVLCRSGPWRPVQLFPVSQTQKVFAQLLLWKLIYGLQLSLNLSRLRRPVYHTLLTSASGHGRFPGFSCFLHCFFFSIICFRKYRCCDFCVDMFVSLGLKLRAVTQTHTLTHIHYWTSSWTTPLVNSCKNVVWILL